MSGRSGCKTWSHAFGACCVDGAVRGVADLLRAAAPRAAGRTGSPARRWGWASWGGVVGVLLWLAGSRGVLSWYKANFASEHGGYDALGTVVVFLAWLRVGHFALLVGVEIDLRLVGRTIKR